MRRILMLTALCGSLCLGGSAMAQTPACAPCPRAGARRGACRSGGRNDDLHHVRAMLPSSASVLSRLLPSPPALLPGKELTGYKRQATGKCKALSTGRRKCAAQ